MDWTIFNGYPCILFMIQPRIRIDLIPIQMVIM